MTRQGAEERIRVLTVLTVPFDRNGITQCVMNYYEKLDHDAFSMDLVTMGAAPVYVERMFAQNGDRVIPLSGRGRNPFCYYCALKKTARAGNYDILHAHGNSNTLAVELLAAKKAGIPTRIPHSHNTTCSHMLEHKLLAGAFSESTTLPMACGQAAGRWLYGDAPFTVLHNAIDTERFAFRADTREETRRRLSLSEHATVFGHVGGFNTQKNHTFLIDVFALLAREVPDARLLLVGDGYTRGATEEKVAALGLSDRVIFYGKTDAPEKLLCAMDAFLLPSLHEGLPFTLLEAQTSGLFCLASDAVTREADMTGNVSFLPLTASPRAWAAAAAELCRGNRVNISAQAADSIRRAGYDIVQNAAQLMEIYRAEKARTSRKIELSSILIMTHNMAGGGCERVIAQLANRFAKQGVIVTIATEYRADSFYPLSDAVRLTALSQKTECRSRDIPKVYGALRRLVREEKPDVVLAMPEKVNVWTVLFLLGRGVPVVVSERNDPRRHPESRVKRLLRRVLYPFATGFVFQTDEAAAYFSKPIQRRGTVLPNPLDTSRIPAPFSGERKQNIVSAGRLEKQKNFPLLIRAFSIFHKAHPNYTLTIYGEGTERDALTALAASLNVSDAVQLPGQTKTLGQDMNDAAMFVLSSDFEGMPNVLIEAMAAGLPCVATDCSAGGCRALIEDHENGLLTKVGDCDALANAMATLADDSALAAALGENAQRIRERLDENLVAEQWKSYLERAIKQKTKRR